MSSISGIYLLFPSYKAGQGAGAERNIFSFQHRLETSIFGPTEKTLQTIDMATGFGDKNMTPLGMAGSWTSIDRRTSIRTVPMNVLCLGLGRTGSSCKIYSKKDSISNLTIPSNAHGFDRVGVFRLLPYFFYH